MQGYCVDCERPVELNEHGACSKCGGTSVINQQMNPGLNTMHIKERANDLLSRLEATGMTGFQMLDEAAMLMLSARGAFMRGITVDQYMESVINTWRIVMETALTPEEQNGVKH